MAEQLWWLTPVLALIGALSGGLVAAWANGAIAERRAERALVREAKVALERWFATRVAPSDVQYPGMDQGVLTEVTNDSRRSFFKNHFAETTKAKAALGAVRHLDHRIAEVLNLEDWTIPASCIDDLRDALAKAERLAARGRTSPK